MVKLTMIEKKLMMGLISCIHTMNSAAALYDANKRAGTFLICGAEIQRSLGTLEVLSRKNKEAKEIIKKHFKDVVPPKPPEMNDKKYIG